jgi:tRNA(fMet)-specific endonuclease VapC
MPPATPDSPLLIDNDVFTHWRNGQFYLQRYLKSYFSYHKQYPALPSITAFEALRGFRRDNYGEVESGLRDSFARLEELIAGLVVIPFDLRAAQIAAEIFPRLAKNQRAALGNDLLIAATALANGLGVVTQNRRDFELIESLIIPSRGPLYIAVWR